MISAHVPAIAQSQIDCVVNIGRTGIQAPTTEPPAITRAVQSLHSHVAVSRAIADGMPRIIARQNSIYVVTPQGAVWQVFDADARSCIGGGVPRNEPDVLARIFVGAAEGSPIRIYRFGIGESRAVTAWSLLAQLERALLGDDRAA